jgi:hypothetical protein
VRKRKKIPPPEGEQDRPLKKKEPHGDAPAEAPRPAKGDPPADGAKDGARKGKGRGRAHKRAADDEDAEKTPSH